MDSTKTYGPVSSQLDASTSPEKTVWLDIYNAADNFLSATYQPLLEKYDDLMNLKVDYIGGDGQTEANITNRLGNPAHTTPSPSTGQDRQRCFLHLSAEPVIRFTQMIAK